MSRRGRPRGANATLRSSRLWGSISGRPEVCVSRCRTVTPYFPRPRKLETISQTRSSSDNCPRSTSSRAPKDTIGFVIDATRKIASSRIGGAELPSDWLPKRCGCVVRSDARRQFQPRESDPADTSRPTGRASAASRGCRGRRSARPHGLGWSTSIKPPDRRHSMARAAGF